MRRTWGGALAGCPTPGQTLPTPFQGMLLSVTKHRASPGNRGTDITAPGDVAPVKPVVETPTRAFFWEVAFPKPKT